MTIAKNTICIWYDKDADKLGNLIAARLRSSRQNFNSAQPFGIWLIWRMLPSGSLNQTIFISPA
jgi:hypothetical protein